MASSYFLNAIRRRWYLPETTVEISDPGRVAHGDVSASAAELPRREVRRFTGSLVGRPRGALALVSGSDDRVPVAESGEYDLGEASRVRNRFTSLQVSVAGVLLNECWKKTATIFQTSGREEEEREGHGRCLENRPESFLRRSHR